jgi:putative transposase
MVRTGRQRKEQVCYYVINRSSDNKKLFQDSSDYRQYLRIIRKYKMRFRVQVFAFCLLPESVHLLIHPQRSWYLSRFMQGISQSYAHYFHASHTVCGQVWHGRFKSRLVEEDNDFVETVRHIEYLAIKAQLAFVPMAYPWNSCRYRLLGAPSRLVDLAWNREYLFSYPVCPIIQDEYKVF